MNNIKKDGTVILNKNDKFYEYHKNFALKKKLRVISFGINSKSATINLVRIKKIKNKYQLFIKVGGFPIFFYSDNDNKSHLYNILLQLCFR